MIRLYHFPLSPFCRKVRLTLAEKRLEVELVEERYWEPSPDFLRRNPAGKVPVLRWDTRVMSESQAICEYLEEHYPTPVLIGANGVEKIVEIEFNAEEKEMFAKSVEAVKGLVDACKTINPAFAK